MAPRDMLSRGVITWALAIHFVEASVALPYIPTTAFLSPVHADLLYIFQESDSSASSSAQLLALNTSAALYASNITDVLETVTSPLPFLAGDSSSNFSYVPVIDEAGQILVFAGDCAASGSDGELWRFEPEASSGNITNGTWSQLSISSAPGPNFLGASISFQTLVGDGGDASMYVFGGMCPTSDATGSVSTWQGNATYTNALYSISPSSTKASASTTATSTTLPQSYKFESSSESSGPIAEAGFTITSLTPSYSNTSSGVATQSRNYVLLGGHTRTAFLNISQIALYSLPEDSWSYVTVDAPTSEGNTELAIKSTSTTSIDSRSGHTATLSSDGSYLIIYGGWVGDVNTAADPQLAYLHLGAGYGGDADWKWEVPTTSGTGPSGDGIYGHSAVLLDGDVLLIYGGQAIDSSSASKRATTGDAYFFNTTSLTWSTSYTNPSYTPPSGQTSSGSSNAEEKRVGLGAGIGLGVAAVLAAVIFFIWYSRKLRRERRARRDAELNKLGADARSYYFPEGSEGQYIPEMYQRGGSIVPGAMQTSRHHGFTGPGYEGYDSHSNSYAPVPSTSYDNYPEEIDIAVSGSQFSVPRKALHSAHARGYYQPAPAFEGSHARNGSLGTSGVIHPIYEADEDLEHEDTASDALMAADASEHASRPGTAGDTSNRWSDPFRDHSPIRIDTNIQDAAAARSIASPTPDSAALEREKEIREWVADWELAAETMMTSRNSVAPLRPQFGQAGVGKMSPSRAVFRHVDDESARTGSNLSERSATTISALTVSRSGSARQTHQRSNSFSRMIHSASSMNPFSTAGSTTLVGSTNVSNSSPAFDKPGELRMTHVIVEKKSSSSSGEDSANSFQTAHSITGFGNLQAEGETLLPRPTGQAAYYAGADSYESGSPSKSKPPRDLKMGFLGSLRKAFLLRADEGSVSPTSSRRNRSPSLSDRDYSPERGLMSGGLYDPTGNDGMPRRTVSAGAMLFRRKQGKGDWEDIESVPGLPTIDSDIFNDRGGKAAQRNDSIAPAKGEDEEDWDVEKAVEKRVVQVMFTVPKEKLRVVNHDVEDDTEEEEAPATLPNLETDVADKAEESSVEASFETPFEKPEDMPIEKPAQLPLSCETSTPTQRQFERHVDKFPDLMATPPPVLKPPPNSRGKVRNLVDLIESRSGSPVSNRSA